MDKVLVISIMILITESSGLSDFWTKANKTLLLSQTRRDTQSPYITPTRDPILDNPAFLPLCGNGRIDTKADYNEYYKTHIPLSLTKQQILYGDFNPENPTMLHNITILADEECDDGNRQDLDGCSADCMHMDLWTSACEIAVDKNLIYEDLTWDPTRQTMVASAADGIYSLEMDPGGNALRAQLIAPKSFIATNIFVHGNSFIIYSSEQQSLWQLVEGHNSFLKVRDFTTESGVYMAAYNAKAFRHDDGSFFLHDEYHVLYIETLNSPAIRCFCGITKKCTFKMTQGRNNIYDCDSFRDSVLGLPPIRFRNKVTVGPGVCDCTEYDFIPEDSENSLLYDTLHLSALKTGFIKKSIPYKMDITISPPESRLKPFAYDYIYHPWGILLEYPLSTARKLGSVGTTANNFYHIGEYSVMRMLTGEDNCGPNDTSICAFDTRQGYDLMQSNPLKYASNITWGNVLHDQVAWEIHRRSLKSIADIKSVYNNRYWVLIDSIFTELYFKPITSNLTVLTFQTHPITHNLWALRRDRLMEISKSGVIAQLPNGKCLPIGLGLCQECHWAPSGLPCRPCSTVDKTSVSWVAKCDNTKCSTSGRRLLADNAQEIRFTLWGNLTKIKAIWPNAVGDSNSCNVTVVTTDPIEEMKKIRLKLMQMQDVQVLTQPHVLVLLDFIPITHGDPNATDNNHISNDNLKKPEDGLNIQVIVILIVSLMLVMIVIILVVFCVLKSKHHNTIRRNKRAFTYHHFG